MEIQKYDGRTDGQNLDANYLEANHLLNHGMETSHRWYVPKIVKIVAMQTRNKS